MALTHCDCPATDHLINIPFVSKLPATRECPLSSHSSYQGVALVIPLQLPGIVPCHPTPATRECPLSSHSSYQGVSLVIPLQLPGSVPCHPTPTTKECPLVSPLCPPGWCSYKDGEESQGAPHPAPHLLAPHTRVSHLVS